MGVPVSDMVLLHAKNKAVSLKVANSVVHVYKDEGMSSTFMQKKVQSNGVHLMQMSFLGEKHVFSKFPCTEILVPPALFPPML